MGGKEEGVAAGVYSVSQVNYLGPVERGRLMFRFQQNTKYMGPSSLGGGNTGVLARRRRQRSNIINASDF